MSYPHPRAGELPPLTPEQERRRDLETAEQQRLRGVKRAPTCLQSKRQLEEDCPTTRDGLPREKVAKWLRQVCTLQQRAGMQLRIPQWGIAMAMFLSQRFFRHKSMRRNDRFVIAMACLHLAAKIEESPKSIRELTKESIRIRYQYLPASELEKKMQPDNLEQHKEEILLGERAVLYTLGFDLNAQHPYMFLVNRLAALGLLQANSEQGNPFKMLMQNAWNFTNDSFRTTLCLQFPAETIAWGALYMAHRVNLRVHPDHSFEKLIAEKTNDPTMTFFKFFNITPQEISEVERQITSVYKRSRRSTNVEQQRHQQEQHHIWQQQQQQQQQQQELAPNGPQATQFPTPHQSAPHISQHMHPSPHVRSPAPAAPSPSPSAYLPPHHGSAEPAPGQQPQQQYTPSLPT